MISSSVVVTVSVALRLRILQKSHLHSHLDDRHGCAILTFKSALELAQNDAFNLAHPAIARTLAYRDFGRERLPDQGFEVLAVLGPALGIAGRSRLKPA